MRRKAHLEETTSGPLCKEVDGRVAELVLKLFAADRHREGCVVGHKR